MALTLLLVLLRLCFGGCIDSIASPQGVKLPIPCGWSAPPTGVQWKPGRDFPTTSLDQAWFRSGRTWQLAGPREEIESVLTRRGRWGLAGSGRSGHREFLVQTLQDPTQYWSPDKPLLDTATPYPILGAGALLWSGKFFWSHSDSLWAKARWKDRNEGDPVEVLLPPGAFDHEGVLSAFSPRFLRFGIHGELTLDSSTLLTVRPLLLEGPPERLVAVPARSIATPLRGASEDGEPLLTKPLKHGTRGLLLHSDRTGVRSVRSIDATLGWHVVAIHDPPKILSRRGGVKFTVDPVEPNLERLAVVPDSVWRDKFRPSDFRIRTEWIAGELGTAPPASLHLSGHAFLDLFLLAWNEHRPVRLTPDAVWMFLLDNYRDVVRDNPEGVRAELVLHTSGKVPLVAALDPSILGELQRRETWEGITRQLLDSMSRHTVSDRHQRMQLVFSTTTPTRALARRIRTLDAYQDFFGYYGGVSCGIPSIHLEGVPEDWKRLRDGVQALRITPTSVWIDGLHPVLDAFVATSEGRPPADFWSSFVRFVPASPECGEVDQIDGWITKLIHSPFRDTPRSKTDSGRTYPAEPPRFRLPIQAPPDHGHVEFTMLLPSGRREFFLASGFTGVHQDRNGTLSAEVGWAVWERHEVQDANENSAP